MNGTQREKREQQAAARDALKAADPFEPLRAELRARGFVVNPWRLGCAVGRAGLELPCPYTLPRSVKLYRDGLRRGDEDRRQAERAARAAGTLPPRKFAP